MIADLDEQLRVDLIVGEVRVGSLTSRGGLLAAPKPSEPRIVFCEGKTQWKR